MSQTVELNVRSQLTKVVDQLQQIAEGFKEVGDEAKKGTEAVGDGINKQTKQTERFLSNLRSFGARVANGLKSDFKALASLGAITGALKLSNQFAGTMKETIGLSDSIRKLGTTFGISQDKFGKFQSFMQRGLGEIGLSAEAASNAIQGLSHTQVRGQENLLEYSKMSGELASVSGQKGQEGNIAQGIADVIRARGGNVNDVGQAKAVAEQLRRVYNATGQGPADTLKSMQEMFTGMSTDLRSKLGPGALSSLATASAVAGPNATKFLEEYLSKSPIQRMAMDAQGMKGVVGANGIDFEKFAKASKNIMGRVGGDPRLAAQTLGISEEAAEGFVRLAQSLKQVEEAQTKVNNSTGNLYDQYKKSMGIGEAFRANINHVMGMFSGGGVLGGVTQGASNMLSGASQSGIGSTAVIAGGGMLAAMLAGGGLRTLFKGAAIEGLTGEKVQKVEVINFPGSFGGSAANAGLAGIAGMGFLKRLAANAMILGGSSMGEIGAMGAGAMGLAGLGVGGAGAAGVGGGLLINKGLDAFTQGTTKEGFQGNVLERLFAKLDVLTDGLLSGTKQSVKVELNKKELKDSKQPTRGGSYGP
jgi:hypothetical protein